MLVEGFPTIVDVNFTANMESLLDGVEDGKVRWKTIVENFYPDKNPAFLDKVCAERGVTIREDNTPVAKFTDEELASDWKEWNEFGRADLISRILPIMPITTIDLTELSGE